LNILNLEGGVEHLVLDVDYCLPPPVEEELNHIDEQVHEQVELEPVILNLNEQVIEPRPPVGTSSHVEELTSGVGSIVGRVPFWSRIAGPLSMIKVSLLLRLIVALP